MIYEPAEDSFLIQKHIKEYAKRGISVLDMGCGSGILAEEALKYTNKENVLAVDITEEAVDFCLKKGINSIKSNLFSNLTDKKFDLILFNPPYLPKDELEDRESSRITSGGKKGNEILIRFLKDAKNHLNKNGKILLIVSSLTPDVETIIKSNNFQFKIIDKQKLFFEELFLYELE